MLVIEAEKIQDRLDETPAAKLITKRLKEDYLKQVGKYKKEVADQYSELKPSNFTYLKCREHRNTVTCVCVSSDDKFIYSGSKDSGIVKCKYFA